MLKNKEYSLRDDLIKLFIIKNKNMKAIDDLIKNDCYLRNIYFAYLKLIDSFNSIQLYYALIKLICEFHTLSFASNQIIKIFANQLPTNPLDSIMESLVQNYGNQDHCDNLLDLVVHHARNGEMTIIGPISGRSDESDPLTKGQQQYINLIDCACELDPRLEEHIDVLEYFNANAYDELKETIMDNSNSKHVRLLAARIYIEKMSTPTSLDFLEVLFSDESVNVEIFHLLIRNKYINLREESIIGNEYLTTLQKKVLLYEFGLV